MTRLFISGVRRRSLWLAGWACLVAIGSAWFHLHSVEDGDTFWHLSLGRAVLEHGSRTFPEPLALASFSAPCTAPEWLWEILTYSVQQLGGWKALSLLLALLSGGVALLLVAWVRASDESAPPGVLVAVSALALVVVLSRGVLRPQVTYHLLLPAFLLVCLRYARARSTAKLGWGLCLAALELLWAQLHGSFVLGPVVFLLVGLGPDLRAAATSESRPVHLVVLLLLAAALLTSAYGTDLLGYLVAHGGGDAVRHIGDMAAPSWGDLDPTVWHRAPFTALLLVCGLGMMAARRLLVRELLLACLGLALFAVARRFVDIAAILMVPLAVRSASSLTALLPRSRALGAVGVAALVGLFVWASLSSRDEWGRRGDLGLDEARLPVAAAAWVRAQPPGRNVLSTYGDAGYLGFALAGHARTYVDGRTPLYFDDTDYAVARQIWGTEAGLKWGSARYRIDVAVAPREGPLCERLRQSGWVPVMTEAEFTTFVPPARAEPLRRLIACGPQHLGGDACADTGAEVMAELARLEAVRPSPFLALLRADLLARCGRSEQARALLAAASDLRKYRELEERVRARLLAAAGRTGDALDLVWDQVLRGRTFALDSVLEATAGPPPHKQLRALLAETARRLGDKTPAGLRVNLARLCAAARDAECVRYHGTLAAVAGLRSIAPELRWLATSHPQERVRADALRWLDELASTPDARAAPAAR